MSRLFGYMIAVLVLLGSLAAAGYMISQRPEPARREPPSQIPFAVTEPVEAGMGAIPVYGSGTVRPRAQVDISAELSGRVVWVDPAFQSGGRVQEGQALFRVDDAEYLNQLARARSDVAIQEVELLKVEEGARVARDEYEQFLRRRGDDEPPVEAGPLALWEPQLEAARATLERFRVAVADADLALSRTEVRAPFDGMVLTEALESGQFVTAGQSVARLYASDAVEVVVPLSDTDASLVPGLWELRAGDANRQVSVRVVADFGIARYAWEGYVDRVEGALDEQTRTLDVIVRVPDPLAGGSLQEGVGAGAATSGRPPSPGRQVRGCGDSWRGAGRILPRAPPGAQARQRSLGHCRRSGHHRPRARVAALRRRRVRDRSARAGTAGRRGRDRDRDRRHAGADLAPGEPMRPCQAAVVRGSP